MRRTAGFSLVELMVASALMGIVVLFLMQTFTRQQKAYVVTDQVTEVQQNSRAISDLIQREVLQAGFMVEESGAVCGVDSKTAPDTLYVSDADAINARGHRTPDLEASISSWNGAAGAASLTLTSTGGVVVDGTPSYDTDGNGVADSDFVVNGGVIIVDKSDPSKGAACGMVRAVTPPNRIDVQMDNGLTGVSTSKTLVAIPAHRIAVDANRRLTHDGTLMAEDVEDLQVAYFFDKNSNGAIDANEYYGVTGNDYSPVAANVQNASLREMRVNLVLRTRTSEPGENFGQFQATENRQPNLAADGFRRRVHTLTVRPRNVGTRVD